MPRSAEQVDAYIKQTNMSAYDEICVLRIMNHKIYDSCSPIVMRYAYIIRINNNMNALNLLTKCENTIIMMMNKRTKNICSLHSDLVWLWPWLLWVADGWWLVDVCDGGSGDV